jgi:crotonobetainyl-CoA:carnitine CoA-transferase CaiB-like acyl-CoA transferase
MEQTDGAMTDGAWAGVLDGFRVVDAAAFVSGPFAAMMLADLGADVVKVEPPDGDAFRRFGRVEAGMGIMWANTNRNKRAVSIDLKSADGVPTLLGLLADADVLISNWRPGVAEGLGLTPEVVQKANPGLVWCRVSGFGPDGPLSQAPAFDSVIQARSGLMSLQGGHGTPAPVRGYPVDKVTSLFVTQAVLAALTRRGRSGQGAIIDLPMLDTVAYFNGPDLLSERTRLEDDGRPEFSPMLDSVRPIPTADGFVLISPVRGRQLKGMAAAAGHPEWIDEFKTLPNPAERTARIYGRMAEVTPSATTKEWIERFTEHDVPAAPVFDLDGHLNDPHVAENGTYVYSKHPQLGEIRQPRHPARYAGIPRAPAPFQGPVAADPVTAD